MANIVLQSETNQTAQDKKQGSSEHGGLLFFIGSNDYFL